MRARRRPGYVAADQATRAQVPLQGTARSAACECDRMGRVHVSVQVLMPCFFQGVNRGRRLPNGTARGRSSFGRDSTCQRPLPMENMAHERG